MPVTGVKRGRGCDCGPLMRGVELRGGRASRRGSMAPVGERGWRTWRGRRIREAVARASTRVGEGRGKGIRSR
jgi:hypothetical protein